MDKSVKVTILGSRGSIPVSGKSFRHYGGATCCVLVQSASGAVILDAGTGLLELMHHLHGEETLPLFLTHAHLDHVLGLTMFPAAFRTGARIDIYGSPRSGLSVQEQIRTVMSPPLWPVEPHQLPAEILFHSLEEQTSINGALIERLEGNHPGGVSVLRLTVGGKRIVLMTDCTITEDNRDELLSFCHDCDLLLCDGQYSDEEWPSRAAFGHNTWNAAARFARDCGAKLTKILHHDPTHADDILDAACLQVNAICPTCSLACDGEEITL